MKKDRLLKHLPTGAKFWTNAQKYEWAVTWEVLSSIARKCAEEIPAYKPPTLPEDPSKQTKLDEKVRIDSLRNLFMATRSPKYQARIEKHHLEPPLAFTAPGYAKKNDSASQSPTNIERACYR